MKERLGLFSKLKLGVELKKLPLYSVLTGFILHLFQFISLLCLRLSYQTISYRHFITVALFYPTEKIQMINWSQESAACLS